MSEDVTLYDSADKRQVGGNHYTTMGVQPWKVMETLVTREEFIGFLKCSIIKYAMRTGLKAGSDDPGKLRHYQQKLDEVLKG